MEYVKKFLDEINKVYNTNLAKTRVGNKHDGGYILLEELCHKAPCLYSFGIGEDMGFELDFSDRFLQANIKCFDSTIDDLPLYYKNRKKFEFRKQGIGVGYDFYLNGVEKNSVLKMDIEWDEWSALGMYMPITEVSKFSQMVIEFHVILPEPLPYLSPYFRNLYQKVFDRWVDLLFKEMYEVVSRINDNFYIFHIHTNNSLSGMYVDGYWMPQLLEVSFVRKDLVDVYRSPCRFPVDGLDFPNKNDRPDLINTFPVGGLKYRRENEPKIKAS